MRLVIIYFSIKYKGYFHDIYKAIESKEYIPIEELEKIKKAIDDNELQAITIIDDEYPESLKTLFNPPFVLYYKGNKDLLKKESLILTGDFSNEQINKFINDAQEEISKSYTLISNYSKGLDEQIVNWFIEKRKNIILISPNGLDNPYFANDIFKNKKINSNNYLIISEYPNGVNINKRRLVQRNRITIGLSNALIIASSKKESKILSLVSYALEQGKDIYCYPGLQNEEDGNNLLIQDGAIMITSIKNIV